jgi:hypothetical protein
MRIEAGEAELAASTAEVAVIDKRIERTDTKLADAVPLDDPPSTMAAYGLIACILAEAEAGLVWLLSGPVRFLNLSSEKFAGQRVTVVGTLDAKARTIQVDSIAAAR